MEKIGINANIKISIQYFFTNFFGLFIFLYLRTRSRVSNIRIGHIKNSKNSLNSSGIDNMGFSNPNTLYSNASNPIKNNNESASIIRSSILEFTSSTQHNYGIKFLKKNFRSQVLFTVKFCSYQWIHTNFMVETFRISN